MHNKSTKGQGAILPILSGINSASQVGNVAYAWVITDLRDEEAFRLVIDSMSESLSVPIGISLDNPFRWEWNARALIRKTVKFRIW